MVTSETGSEAVDVHIVETLPRYVRTLETLEDAAAVPAETPAADIDAALAVSTLSAGSQQLLRGLLETGGVRVFPGGGLGIEYGALLKRAWRPDVIGPHVEEIGRRLREQSIDLLLAPGNSGHPIAVAYSMASGIPALLLAKTAVGAIKQTPPPGSFIITSYTGSEEVVISADPDAVRTVVEAVLRRRQASDSGQSGLRIAAIDDIIDKSTMAQALIECGPSMVRASVPGDVTCRVVAMVAPLMKQYTGGASAFAGRFGFEPTIGLGVTRVQLDPPAIGISGAGLLPFPR